MGRQDITNRILNDKRVKKVIVESAEIIQSTPTGHLLTDYEYQRHLIAAIRQSAVIETVAKGIRKPSTKKTDLKDLHYGKESNFDLEWKMLRLIRSPENKEKRPHSYNAIRRDIGLAEKGDSKFRKSLSFLIQEGLVTDYKTSQQGKVRHRDLGLTPKGEDCFSKKRGGVFDRVNRRMER